MKRLVALLLLPILLSAGCSDDSDDDAEGDDKKPAVTTTTGGLELGSDVTIEESSASDGAGVIEDLEDLAAFVTDQAGVTEDQADCIVGVLLETYDETELIDLASSGAAAPPEYAEAIETCAAE